VNLRPGSHSGACSGQNPFEAVTRAIQEKCEAIFPGKSAQRFSLGNCVKSKR
jgi:hypothetical protein